MTTPLLKAGQVLCDRYVISKYIDEGGMQQVFAAEDRSFRRIVALKVPKNDSAVKRFERSARVSARVTHPNVAKTLDYFEEGGLSFLIEELIVGKNLEKALADEYFYFDPYMTAMFLHSFAKGVAASHHAGVFHRDLKPSNIMMASGFDVSALKVTDFGIAKMAAAELEAAVEHGESSLEASQTAKGALPYMAPELIDTPKAAGTPADIWAIGAIAYRLMTGKLPFGEGWRSVVNIMEAKLPPHPLLFEKYQFRNLTEELWKIVRECLHKEPQRRPTADQLVGLLSRVCYADGIREVGVIESVKPGNGRWGKIRSDAGHSIFYHEDSLYAGAPVEGMRVNFCSFPGFPDRRAFPVLPLKPRRS